MEVFRLLKKPKCCRKGGSFERFRQSIYLVLEEPGSSIIARMVTVGIFLCITISTVMIIVDSMPIAEEESYQLAGENIDLVISCIFLVEIIFRIMAFTSFGDKFINYITVFNILDILAVMPTFIEFLLSSEQGLKQFRVIRAIRFIKVFRMLKVSRYLKGFSLLTEGLIRSFKTMMVYTIILFVINIFMATIMYFTSLDEETVYAPTTKIETLPDAMWWALATMTTVGYGDKLPQTGYSRIVAIFTALCGLSMISMPIAILGTNMSEVCLVEAERDQINRLKKEAKRISKIKTKDKILREILFLQYRIKTIRRNNDKIRDCLKKSQVYCETLEREVMSLYRKVHKQTSLVDFKSGVKKLGKLSFQSKIEFYKTLKSSTTKLSLKNEPPEPEHETADQIINSLMVSINGKKKQDLRASNEMQLSTIPERKPDIDNLDLGRKNTVHLRTPVKVPDVNGVDKFIFNPRVSYHEDLIEEEDQGPQQNGRYSWMGKTEEKTEDEFNFDEAKWRNYLDSNTIQDEEEVSPIRRKKWHKKAFSMMPINRDQFTFELNPLDQKTSEHFQQEVYFKATRYVFETKPTNTLLVKEKTINVNKSNAKF